MGSVAAILLATPIFGFSLQTPAWDVPQLSTGSLPPAVQASASQLGANAEQDAAEQGGGDSLAAAEREYKEQMRERAEIIRWHRPLGIATWASMTATVVLGSIQYYNLYGFFDDQGSNPCVQGDAIFGQSQCSGFPWPHGLTAIATTALYTGTFTLSLLMPDPDDAASGDSEYAQTLRLHKLLRWVHLGGMISQLLVGAVIANDLFGLDRANDYGTLQALATAHVVSGLVTYGALTWAGALMVF